MRPILFSVPFLTGVEEGYVRQVLESDHWHGDGAFTDRATQRLRELTDAPHVLTTTSCTHALELAALLLDVGVGDEVICPTFTFTSTATAIAIRGATPVFVDSDPLTMNLNPDAVAAAITPKTKAVFAVHYGGIPVAVDQLLPLCERNELAFVEDNAHGFGATYRGRPLGSFGDLAALSFHDTKNVAMGEGGALLFNNATFAERAEIIREKGTNRSAFLRGAVDKYTWVDQGSSYLPAELLAAVLCAQLEGFETIQALRHRVWSRYDLELAAWARSFGVTQMFVPPEVEHPAHLYYLMMPTSDDQQGLIRHLRSLGITATFHYQPLDHSPAGSRVGRTPFECSVAHDQAGRLVRLPLHANLSEEDVSRVVDGVRSYVPVACSVPA